MPYRKAARCRHEKKPSTSNTGPFEQGSNGPGQDEVLQDPARLMPRRRYIGRRRLRHHQPSQHPPRRMTTGPAPGNAFTQLQEVSSQRLVGIPSMLTRPRARAG